MKKCGRFVKWKEIITINKPAYIKEAVHKKKECDLYLMLFLRTRLFRTTRNFELKP